MTPRREVCSVSRSCDRSAVFGIGREDTNCSNATRLMKRGIEDWSLIARRLKLEAES